MFVALCSQREHVLAVSAPHRIVNTGGRSVW